MFYKFINSNKSNFSEIDSRNKNIFPFSKEPSQIEHYKCFDDNSNMEWIDGKEFLKIDWNNIEGDTEVRKKLWLYFYRPYNYGNNIAPKQKELIKTAENDISSKKNQLDLISTFIFFTTCIEVWLLFTNDIFFLNILPILFIFIFFTLHYYNDQKIVRLESDIVQLKEEISILVNQQKKLLNERLSSKEVEKIFWEDIRNLEKDFIENFLTKNIENERKKANNFYYKSPELAEFFESNNIAIPIYPVIPSWGLLQDSQSEAKDLQRTTGLGLIGNKIGKKIATWRQSRNSKVFFRIWFIQFLFFQDKAFYSVSFYYDFILKKKYGLKKEKFLYNHIASCSYNEETLSYMIDAPIMEKIGLPKDFTMNIYSNETKTISFSTTSSDTYRCVLPDADISDSLNSWLKKKQEYYQNLNQSGSVFFEDDEKFYLYEKLKHDSSIILPLAMQAFKEIGIRTESFSIDVGSVKSE